MDGIAPAANEDVVCDRAGRVQLIRRGSTERVFRHNQAGEMQEALVDAARVARCVYDHKGRLVLKSGPGGSERYLYGADDGLLAVADGAGEPRMIFLRLPTGIVGMIDFRSDPRGRIVCLHNDAQGNLVFAGSAEGDARRPVRERSLRPAAAAGRTHALSLPRTRLAWRSRPLPHRLPLVRSLAAALSHPRHLHGRAGRRPPGQPVRHRAASSGMARAEMLAKWLPQPRLRNRHAYCANDPVNRFDPNGHWSVGGVLLSVLGVLWTLPNTAFGLAIEVSCLLGEVVRWLVWAVTAGHVSWQTPGFDVASSGRLDAFALVFKGGWLGSFESLLGITFGNVIFVNGKYQEHPAWQALPDPVTPPAYGGTVTIPKSAGALRARADPRRAVQPLGPVLPSRAAAVRHLRVGRHPARLPERGLREGRPRPWGVLMAAPRPKFSLTAGSLASDTASSVAAPVALRGASAASTFRSTA